MDKIQLLLLALGLAMDAAAVSMTNGMEYPRMRLKTMLFMAAAFGIFQGVMPLIGYSLGSLFTSILSNYAPFVSLILLSVIGIKMIREAIKKEEDIKKEFSLKMLLLQAIATSIDALAIGIVFLTLGYARVSVNSLVIAAVTAVVCLLAVWIGKKFGAVWKKNAQIAGGIILIGLGLKICIEHLIEIL